NGMLAGFSVVPEPARPGEPALLIPAGGPCMEPIDLATAQAAERLDVPPSGRAGESAIERARESIGVRVERMLATLAFRAAALGQRELPISDGRRFTPLVSRELLSRIPVNLHEAT